MKEKLNLNPTVVTVFDTTNLKKVKINKIDDTFICDGRIFIKEGINKTLDKKIELKNEIRTLNLNFKIEDITEVDERVNNTMLKNKNNRMFLKTIYYIYFKKLSKKLNCTLKFSNYKNIYPTLLLLKDDKIVAGALGLRIRYDFIDSFNMEKTIKDYENELYYQNVYNEDIMNTIFSIYKKNVLSSTHIEKFNFYKENLKDYSKKDFKFKKDGIYFDYISEKGKPIKDIPLFNKILSYDFFEVQNYQIVDTFWNFDIKTKKYLYNKILSLYI